MNNELIDDSGAAFVCEHIAVGHLPILIAHKDAPMSPEDSGWQFSCNSGKNEEPANAKIWSIKEVLEYDPSLAGYLTQPNGTKLWRMNIHSNWRISKESNRQSAL